MWNRKRPLDRRCAADAEAMRRCEPRRSDRSSWSAASIGSVGDPERAREHVRRAAGQRRERGVGAGEPVGGLVERAVAGEHDHDVEAVVAPRRARAGRVAAPRRLGDLDVVLGGEHLAGSCTPLARGGHRRRGRVHEQEHAHGGEPYVSASRPRAIARPEPRAADLARADRARSSACRACPRLVAWREQVAGRSGPRSATRSTGAGRCPASATRTPGCSSSGSRPPRTAATAPAGSSPATARATSCSRRCTAPASPTSRRRCAADDGLELRDAYVAAAVRCAPPANKPTPDERDRCLPYLERELAPARPRARDRRARRVRLRGDRRGCSRRAGVAAPGAAPEVRPRARGADGARRRCSGCFHPSQQNTFTGRLTEPMLDDVFARARELADAVPSRP